MPQASLAAHLDEAGVAPLLLFAPPGGAEIVAEIASGARDPTEIASSPLGEARRHTMAAQLVRASPRIRVLARTPTLAPTLPLYLALALPLPLVPSL